MTSSKKVATPIWFQPQFRVKFRAKFTQNRTLRLASSRLVLKIRRVRMWRNRWRLGSTVIFDFVSRRKSAEWIRTVRNIIIRPYCKLYLSKNCTFWNKKLKHWEFLIIFSLKIDPISTSLSFKIRHICQIIFPLTSVQESPPKMLVFRGLSHQEWFLRAFSETKKTINWIDPNEANADINYFL